MALTITFFSCRLFLYFSYNMWRLMHSVEISFLDSDCLLTSSVIQNTCIWWPHCIWPLASYLFRWFLRSQPFFTRDAYCIARPCYGFLSVLPSVRPSVSRKVCPRRRGVSLRQLSSLCIIHDMHIVLSVLSVHYTCQSILYEYVHNGSIRSKMLETGLKLVQHPT